MITEEILIKAKNGDQSAIEEICAAFAPVIKRLPRTYFLMGGESEDVMQEATLGLIFAIRDYEKGHNTSFETFARHCIYRRVMTAIRLASGGKHFVLNTAESLDSADIADGDPLESLLKEEWHKLFWEAAQSELSKTEALVLKLYVQGYAYSQIAEVLQKDLKAVDNALERVRKKLKVKLM